MNKKYAAIALSILSLVLMSVFFIGCETTPDTPIKTPTTTPRVEPTQELKKFNSAEDIKKYLEENQKQSSYTSFYGGGRGVMMDMVAESSGAPMATKVAASSSNQVAADYSQTNVQVQGVDEADFVKNDDKYIYVLAQDKLVIADAYPAENANILSKTEIDGRPSNLFVNKDRLVVFSVADDEAYSIPEYGFAPQMRYSQRTHAYVYDISDRKDPKQINDFNIDGYYFDARMIGDYVYFVTKDNVYYYNDIITLPAIRNGREKIISPDVFYFDNPENEYVFHTVASFNIQKDTDVNAKSFLMGYSNTLYVSEDNIYISYQKNEPNIYYKEHNEDRFYKVILPLLPEEFQSKINDVKSEDITSYAKWSKISSILEDMYNTMSENNKETLVNKISDAVEEYEAKLEIERRKTIIQKIGINNGDIDYKAKGEVSGYLLNQFSLDEYNGNLRVATTTEIWSRSENQQYNNVYVLDKDMEIIGSLEEIAPDERIYSTRFVGERLYMVTFKRVDPLFVIDLSEPTNPNILGKLKIPGFSDYLHPYDENHIIGIGKETADNEWGGTSIKGVKLALFDVTDVANPKQISEYEIGEPGTDSEALQEHKAFLFDKEKNLLVIPIREIKGKQTYDARYGYYRQRVWQGAYVFSLTPQDGFKLKGKISHNEGEEENRWYWGSPYAVRRSLYMDDVLYTVSAKKIVMNDLDNIDDELNSLDLPFKQEIYYPFGY